MSRQQLSGKTGVGNGKEETQDGRCEGGEKIKSPHQDKGRQNKKREEKERQDEERQNKKREDKRQEKSRSREETAPGRSAEKTRTRRGEKTGTPKKTVEPPPKSFPEKVAGAFSTVVDILTDAEQLHHKLEPEISREPE